MMSRVRVLLFASIAPLLAAGALNHALAQQSPMFTPGNLVVSVEGCGVYAGTCTAVANGTGTGAGNSSAGGYGDNQAAPLTLFQYAPTGATSANFVNSLVLPQTASGANVPVSGEYGSSSEGTIQLSGPGQYLTIMGYGVAANAFNANPNAYSVLANTALAQSDSLTGKAYIPVARVVSLIDAYGNVNSATALYNIFDTNNPRSAYTVDGVSQVYVSGQGSGCDQTGGVFLSPLGATNNAPTAITGSDASSTSTCNSTSGLTVIAQDTRELQVYNGTLYVSADSTSGKNDNRSMIGTLGTPPATSLFTPGTPNPYTTGPFQLNGFGNTGGTGKVTLTTATANGVNSSGLQVNISPENFFFASPSVLYVADSGSPKQTSATSLLGAGGLQKWVNSAANGSGTWSLAYTLYKGLNLVANTAAKSSDTSGTTGLYGLTGTVVSGTVYLYATNYTISDLDPTYLYGISDTLSSTSNPGTSFTQLAAAPQDSNFKGVSFAPTLPPASATITSSPSGLSIYVSGFGCGTTGNYTTPVTLSWTPGSSCELNAAPNQAAQGENYTFVHWQDGSVSADFITAPSTPAVYAATFAPTATATPAFSVPTGSYTSAQSVTISDTVANSSIYYTTDGSTPTSASTLYSSAITVSTSETLNAIAVGTGDVSSAVASATYTIAPATTTTLTSSSYPSLVGQTVTFTATVASAGVAPTGTVQFSVNGTALGSPVTLNSGGVATISSSTLPTGNLNIVASFTPANGVFLQSSTATYTQEVTESAQQSGNVSFNNSVRTLGSGFSHPYATAVDANDNVFVADSGNAAVKEILAAGGYTTVNSLGSGFNYPTSVALDAAGNLFVADPGNTTIYELPSAGGYVAVNNLGRGFNSPYGVAVDANDDVYIADTGNSAVKEMSPCGSCGGGYGPAGPLGGGFQYPWNVAVDASGNVFATDIGNRTLNEITAASSYATTNTVANGFFGNPYGLAADASGDVYVTDLASGTLREVSSVDGFTTVSTPAYGFNLPIGVAVDASGSLFVADTYNNAIREISQKGGNFGSVTVGIGNASPISMVFFFHVPTTLGSTAVLSQGTGGNAYLDAGTGTCTANTAYAANTICTVDVNFNPIVPGARSGSVELLDGSGNVLAVGSLQATGVAH